MSVFRDLNPGITEYPQSFGKHLSKIADLSDMISHKTMYTTNKTRFENKKVKWFLFLDPGDNTNYDSYSYDYNQEPSSKHHNKKEHSSSPIKLQSATPSKPSTIMTPDKQQIPVAANAKQLET